MKMIMTYIMACALGLITAGCSTIGLGGADDNKMVEIPKSKVNHIPEWFLQKPVEGAITVTATGVKDVQREIDRVSKVRVNQELSFFTREHVAVIREGDHFRAFVMLKINQNEARRLTTKDNSKSREDRLKELDKTSDADDQIKVRPVAEVDKSKMLYNTIKDEEVKKKVEKVLQDPNAVVISATIR
jgi:hypothetical protein